MDATGDDSVQIQTSSIRDVRDFDRLFPEFYDALRGIAHNQLRSERAGHTLDTSGLVHETYLKLTRGRSDLPVTESQFLSFCAQLMRQILVDHARGRGRLKRGGDMVLTTLTENVVADAPGKQTDLLAIDDALNQLSVIDPIYARIVECRYFAGMSIAATASALGSSPSSIKRQWRFARAWLERALTPPAPT